MNALRVKSCTAALLDSMGGDEDVVRAARVSVHRSDVAFPKDAGLIRYLAKSDPQHWTPFAHVMMKVRIEAPIFIARQWFKSVVGVVRNEVSRRYVATAPAFFMPEVLHRRPEDSIKQGASPEEHFNSGALLARAGRQVDEAAALYADMILQGVAPQEARMFLPQNMMTAWVETGSLPYFARVCGLRLDKHTQGETTALALLVADEVSPVSRMAWEALMGLDWRTSHDA